MVHGDAAGNVGLVLDNHMPAQHHVIGDDAFFAQLDIVGDVGVGHEIVVIPQRGGVVARGAVDGDGLA